MTTKMYDPRCYDLASVFLEDEPATTETHAQDLAAHIQQAVEDWIADLQRNREPPDPPGWEGGFAENH